MTDSLGWGPGSEVGTVVWDPALSLPVSLPGMGAKEMRRVLSRCASFLTLIHCAVVVR